MWLFAIIVVIYTVGKKKNVFLLSYETCVSNVLLFIYVTLGSRKNTKDQIRPGKLFNKLGLSSET